MMNWNRLNKREEKIPDPVLKGKLRGNCKESEIGGTADELKEILFNNITTCFG